MKIDSHHHLWAINDTDYVWMSEAHAVIRRDFLSAGLNAALDESGLDGSVAVQARQMTGETDFLLGIADANPRIKAVVGWVPLCENGGERILMNGGSTDESRASWAYREVLGKSPAPAQLAILLEPITGQRGFFKTKSSNAEALLKIGESKADPALDPIEAATFTTLAQSLLNLDANITLR